MRRWIRRTFRVLKITVVAVVGTLLAVLLLFVLRVNLARNSGCDLVLITEDTQRADHLGCYGTTVARTPNANRLAREGVLYRNAVTVIPRTTQGIASIMTGRYPQDHGVHELLDRLPEDETTLAELLRQEGFRTAAFVNGGPMGIDSNLYQGFDRTAVFPFKQEIRALPIVLRALVWLVANYPKRYFLWVHIYDDHFVYAPPWPFWDPDDPRNRDAKRLYDGLEHGLLRFGDVHFRNALSEPVRQYLRQLYAQEVEYTDFSVGVLMKAIRVLNALDPGRKTLVVLTADHGESLGEKDYYYTHGNYLYDVDVKIPLIFSLPGELPQGAVADFQVRNIDILPTILDILHAPAIAEVRGTSLLPRTRGGQGPDLPAFIEGATNIYPENPRYHISGPAGRWQAVRTEKLKLIRIPRSGSDEFELYDLSQDPGEQVNLHADRPQDVESLKALLREFEASASRRRPESAPVLDEEQRRKLRSLGYVD